MEHEYKGSFTLPDTETDKDTYKMYSEPNGNLHQYSSPSSIITSTQFYRNHFSSVPASVSARVTHHSSVQNCDSLL